MPVFTESSISAGVAEQERLRRLNTRIQISLQEAISTESTTTADPDPQIPSIIQSARCKSTILSLLLSSSGPSKKKSSTFRGLGCTAGASQQVSVPAVIRTSAEWEEKKVKKEKKKSPHEQKEKKNSNNEESKALNFDRDRESCVVFPDVWCGPGIGFSADAVGSVDCVVARRNKFSGRGKIDYQRERERERERDRDRNRDRDRDRQRERPPFFARRTVNPDTLSFLDSDTSFVTSRPEPEVFGSRYYRHVRHPSPGAIAEIMMQNSFGMGGRIDQHDRFSDWRLDVDDMTYEELLELGERIGYVSTGLKAYEIGRCLRKIKQPISSDLSLHLTAAVDKKCSICQDEYEASNELGKLHCGHTFHTECIKQWLGQKNACPVCKTAAVAGGSTLDQRRWLP